jgi:hypothetical protein
LRPKVPKSAFWIAIRASASPRVNWKREATSPAA